MTCNRLRIPSRFLRNPAEIILLIPGKGANRNAPEKCLLFFHGAGENPQTILDNSPLADLAETWNLRIVLPFVGNSFGLDCGEGERYHAFLSKELIPRLGDALFATAGKTGSFRIGGISMGAYIALQLGLERRELISGIFSISGAYDLRKAARFGRVCGLEIPPVIAELEARPGECARRLLERYAGGGAPPLYFACGNGDLFYDTNRMAADWAQELKYSVRWKDRPGLHNWDYWREALPSVLQWAAMTGGSYGK